MSMFYILNVQLNRVEFIETENNDNIIMETSLIQFIVSFAGADRPTSHRCHRKFVQNWKGRFTHRRSPAARRSGHPAPLGSVSGAFAADGFPAVPVRTTAPVAVECTCVRF